MASINSSHGGSQGIIAIIAIICIAIAAVFIFRGLKEQSEAPPGDAYYYCEDCDYEFTASSTEIPPIKCPKTGTLTAVHAIKFKGADGKAFTGYYEKYDLETKRLIEALKRGEKVDQGKIKQLLIRGPDDTDWVESLGPDGIAIINSVTSPTDDSTGEALGRVYPLQKKE